MSRAPAPAPRPMSCPPRHPRSPDRQYQPHRIHPSACIHPSARAIPLPPRNATMHRSFCPPRDPGPPRRIYASNLANIAAGKPITRHPLGAKERPWRAPTRPRRTTRPTLHSVCICRPELRGGWPRVARPSSRPSLHLRPRTNNNTPSQKVNKRFPRGAAFWQNIPLPREM